MCRRVPPCTGLLESALHKLCRPMTLPTIYGNHFSSLHSSHLSWLASLLGATISNGNIVAVWAETSAVKHIMAAICSLVILHVCSVWALFVPARPNYTVPTVIGWAELGIYFQLDQLSI